MLHFPTYEEFQMPYELSETGSPTLRVSGDIDAFEVPKLAEQVREAAADPARRSGLVTLDLGSVSFLDAAAVEALVEVNDYLAEGGQSLVLCDPSALVTRMIELAGVEYVFTIQSRAA